MEMLISLIELPPFFLFIIFLRLESYMKEETK